MNNVEIKDDGKNPIEQQKVVIKVTETKELVQFDGTLSDLKDERRPRLVRDIEAKQAELAGVDALIASIEVELSKLPPRKSEATETAII